MSFHLLHCRLIEEAQVYQLREVEGNKEKYILQCFWGFCWESLAGARSRVVTSRTGELGRVGSVQHTVFQQARHAGKCSLSIKQRLQTRPCTAAQRCQQKTNDGSMDIDNYWFIYYLKQMVWSYLVYCGKYFYIFFLYFSSFMRTSEYPFKKMLKVISTTMRENNKTSCKGNVTKLPMATNPACIRKSRAWGRSHSPFCRHVGEEEGETPDPLLSDLCWSHLLYIYYLSCG